LEYCCSEVSNVYEKSKSHSSYDGTLQVKVKRTDPEQAAIAEPNSLDLTFRAGEDNTVAVAFYNSISFGLAKAFDVAIEAVWVRLTSLMINYVQQEYVIVIKTSVTKRATAAVDVINADGEADILGLRMAAIVSVRNKLLAAFAREMKFGLSGPINFNPNGAIPQVAADKPGLTFVECTRTAAGAGAFDPAEFYRSQLQVQTYLCCFGNRR